MVTLRWYTPQLILYEREITQQRYLTSQKHEQEVKLPWLPGVREVEPELRYPANERDGSMMSIPRYVAMVTYLLR